jgi:hypothetical protein
VFFALGQAKTHLVPGFHVSFAVEKGKYAVKAIPNVVNAKGQENPAMACPARVAMA